MPNMLPPVVVTIDVLRADSIASDLVRRLFAAEQTSEVADSLFDTESIVIANGEPRLATPRLAGVTSGGQLQLITSRVATTGVFVWGVLEYRWLPASGNAIASTGLATVVLAQRRDGTWRLVHLHSSSGDPEGP
jgi:hypothetical protein